MKTTVVPAQITTVEDRIAGSLTLPQIMLLVFSLVIGSAIFGVVAPRMHLGPIKTIAMTVQFVFLAGLAIRFHGKILAEWLIVYLRFRSRPRRYIFTKNDLTSREIIVTEEYHTKKEKIKEPQNIIKKDKPITVLEELNIGRMLEDDSLSISFKPSKKGGLNVSLQKKN